jgi:hypothetical protein
VNPFLTMAIVWVSVTVAVSVGIVITQSATPLWALIIPACISYSSKPNEKEEEKEEEQ